MWKKSIQYRYFDGIRTHDLHFDFLTDEQNKSS